MGSIKDLTGHVFGRLTVVSFSHTKRYAYWNCICTCGIHRIIRGTSLRHGVTTSCGCFNRENVSKTHTGDGLSSARDKFGDYMRSSRRRGYGFFLTFEQFIKITQQICVYCGSIPHQTHKSRSCSNTFTYNGIDRRDNSLGYTLENCFPCCGKCNHAKDTMTHDEYISLCKRIAANWQ